MNSKKYMRDWARKYRASDRYLSKRPSVKRLLLKKPLDWWLLCMTLYSLMSPKRKGQIKEALLKRRARPGRIGRPRGKS